MSDSVLDRQDVGALTHEVGGERMFQRVLVAEVIRQTCFDRVLSKQDVNHLAADARVLLSLALG